MPQKVIDTPESETTLPAKALAKLAEHVFVIGALAMGALSIALYVGVDLSLDRLHVLGMLCAGWGATAGYPISGYVVGKIGEVPGVYLVDVEAEDPDHDGGIYWVPYSEFQEYTTTDGALDQWGPFLYCGKHVNPDELTVEGVWRGTLEDRKLLSALSAVQECRGMLQEDARKAFHLETNLWSVVYRASKDATAAVVTAFADGTLPDRGEGIDGAVDDALEEMDVDRLADAVDDDELLDDATPDDAETLGDAASADGDSTNGETPDATTDVAQ